LAHPLLDDVFETHESPPTDEEDVRGVDLQELLLRVLATTFWRHVADGAFQNLQQRLLNTLT